MPVTLPSVSTRSATCSLAAGSGTNENRHRKLVPYVPQIQQLSNIWIMELQQDGLLVFQDGRTHGETVIKPIALIIGVKRDFPIALYLYSLPVGAQYGNIADFNSFVR